MNRSLNDLGEVFKLCPKPQKWFETGCIYEIVL